VWELSERLQSESKRWWPFPTSTRPLPGLRCRGCTLVIFWYTPVEQPKSNAETRDPELEAFVYSRAQEEPKRTSAIHQLLGDYRIKLEETPDAQLKRIAYYRALQQANLTQVIDFNAEELSRDQLIEQLMAEYREYLKYRPFEELATMLRFRKPDRDNDGNNSQP
jgi:hypothetical protein